MSKAAPKAIEWPSVATFHDPRSSPDAVPWGRWRLVENMETVDGTWQRRSGWKRHGHWMSSPTTADLRVRPDASTDPIRALYVHVGPSGARRLFAASGSIYSQFHDGRWKTLLTGEVGDRYQFASVGDLVFAVNGAEPVRYHVLDSDNFKTIPSLESIGLYSARMAVSWKGILFLGDVTMDGVRVGNRVVWSGLESPLQFEPTTDSIAGFQDLDPGEVVLAGAVMGDSLYLFTTLSIWRVSVVGGEAYFSFQQVYYDRNGAGCLAARYSLAVWRDSAIYLSRDGVQVFGAFSAAPEQPAWMHHATAAVDTSDFSRCQEISVAIRTGGEVWISFPSGASQNPNRTVVLNVGEQSSDEIDHGFTALLSAQLDDSMEVIEWMRVKLGCSSAAIDALFPPSPGEVRDTFDGDFPGMTVEELCNDPDLFPGCDGCPTEERFLVVSSSDGALKSVEEDYFARDQWNGTEYVATGYKSRWVTGALNFGSTEWKRATEVSLGLIPVATDEPRDLQLRVSASGTPADLTSGCNVRTFVMRTRKIECPAVTSTTKQPNAHFRWPIIAEGRYLYLDFEVPACTGGGFTISRLGLVLQTSPNSTL